MPQIQSAKKRVRTTARQTAENRLHKSRSRESMKKIRDLMADGKVAEAMAEFSTTQTYLDKAAKKRAWHPNTAARYKSRLAAALKVAGAKTPVPKRSIEKNKPAAKASPKAASTAAKPNPRSSKPAAKAEPNKKA